jgi:hypothetical protein
MLTIIYVKPMTWAGKTKFYIGLQPSNPAAGYGHQLGSYFLVVDSREGAVAVAEAEARRMTGLGRSSYVVECPHYVGL